MSTGGTSRTSAYRVVLGDAVAGRLLFVQSISELGDFVGLSALLVLAYRQTGSVLGPAAVFAARTVPAVLVGTVFSSWLDRPPRRAALVALAYIGAFLVAAAAMHPTVIVALAVAALLGAHRTAAQSVTVGIVVDSVEPEVRGAFFALSTSIYQCAEVVGLVIGASATVLLGERASLAFDAVTFLAGAALLSKLPAIAAHRRERRPAPTEGFRTVMSEPTLRKLCPVVWASVSGLALPATLAPRIAHGAALPIVMAAAPLGLMVAALTLGRGTRLHAITTQFRMAALLGGAFALGAIALVAGGPIWTVALANVAVGAASAWIIGARTTFANRTPPERIAQVESTMIASVVLIEGVGVLCLGWLVTWAGPWVGYAIAAACISAITLPKLVAVREPRPAPRFAPALESTT